MPEYNGLDGISMIRHFEIEHNLPKTFICLMSADTPDESEFDQYEHDTFICKPLTYQKVNQIIELRKQQILEEQEVSVVVTQNQDNSPKIVFATKSIKNINL